MHHLDSLHAMAKKKGLEFVYIPQLFNDISSSGNRLEELVHYYFPYSKQPVIGSPKLDYFTTPFFTNFLLPKLGFSGNMQPGLIRFTNNEFFDYRAFDLSGEKSLEEQCSAYFSQHPDVPKVVDTKPTNVLETILNNIEELKQLGIYELLIKEVGAALNDSPQKQKTQANKLSRLVIDVDFRIWLPDYDNKEIKMTPLPKALYLLFLRYPEGISLKYISDYKLELTNIYKQVSNRINYADIIDSIERICTPTDNSINEKLSRIRDAFVRKIDEEYAQFYYVSGKRGQARRIEVDRNLVMMNDSHF